MGHGESPPIYVQSRIWQEDPHLARVAVEFVRSRCNGTSDSAVLALIYDPPKDREYIWVRHYHSGKLLWNYFIGWPDGVVTCEGCSGAGAVRRARCEACLGSAAAVYSILDANPTPPPG